MREKLGIIKSTALISQPAYICQAAGAGSCSPDTIAYVKTGTSFEIHLCPAFFQLSDAGADSKSGTILHEMSHFHLGTKTEDECYGNLGIGSCLDLAIREPDLAVQNADSYQYFIELGL